MEPINGINGKEQYNIQDVSKPIQAPSPPLLPELIQFILTDANYEDNHLTGGISKAWNSAFVDINKTQEFRSLKSFVDFAVAHLDEDKYADQIKELASAIDGTPILKSVNLLEVKSSSYELKEKILNILKNVDQLDLKLLESKFKESNKDIVIPKFPHLVEEYKSLDLITTNFPEFNAKFLTNFTEADALKDSIIKLIHLNAFEKAFEVASSNHLTDHFFDKLLPYLSRTNQMDKAFLHVNTLLESNLETNSMENVFKTLNSIVTSNLLGKIPKNLDFPTQSVTLKYKTFVTLLENVMTNIAMHSKPLTSARNIKSDETLDKIGLVLSKYILPRLPLPTCYDLMLKLQAEQRTDEAEEIALILSNSGDEKYENLAETFLKDIGKPILSLDDFDMDDYNDHEK